MDLDSLILISVDDHIVEPPNMFDNHLPAKWREHAPRLTRAADGSDVWTFAGNEMPSVVLGAVAGRVPEEWGLEPTSYQEVREGCYDVGARVDDMNVGGVIASLCFPQFPGFAGRAFSTTGVDQDVAFAVISAYNDWHIDEWCGAAPGRFIPTAIVPLWDAELAAKEARRVSEKGCHSLTFPGSPEMLGFPSLYSQTWDPLWAACVELGIVVNMHIGSAGINLSVPPEAPIDATMGVGTTMCMASLNDIVWSKMLVRFPELKVAISEGDVGWVPHMLERLENSYNHHSLTWTGVDFGDRPPSQVAREQIYFCFIRDRLGLNLRDEVGIDHISWEQDYPHSDTRWPRAPEVFLADAVEAGMTEDEIHRVSHRNAMELYHFDPFQVVRREDANVESLRRLAQHVDVTPKAFGSRYDSKIHLREGAGGAAKTLTKVAGGVAAE